MERYLDAASKISRLAVGDPPIPVMVNIHQLPLEEPQDARVEELPFGTRGGMAIRSYFPLDGEYDIQVDLAGSARDAASARNHAWMASASNLSPIGGAGGRGGRGGGGGGRGGASPISIRIPVKAGRRLIGVTFVQSTEALDEATLRPAPAQPRNQPAIATVTISGPYNANGPGDTPSRERIFACHPRERRRTEAGPAPNRFSPR